MHTLRVCAALAAASVRGEMQYRFNFVTEMGFGLLYNSIGFVFIAVVLGQFDAIGGWTLGEVTLLYGLRLCGHGLWALAFSNAMSLDWYVQSGEWDRMLVRPIPAFAQMMVANFRVAVFGDALAGMITLAIGISLADIEWSAQKLLYLVATLIGSAALDGAFQVGPAALAFRYLATEGIRGNFDYIFTQFGGYPLTILDRRARYALTFAIPLAFIAWVPGAVLLDRTNELPMPSWTAWCSPLVGIVMLAVALWLFLRESRHYQSAGS